MALRAFSCNPSLGGFGGESCVVSPSSRNDDSVVEEKDCDAFGQIIKELVDNAVDACSDNSQSLRTEAKRVRVIIRGLQDDTEGDIEHDADLETNEEILRVTVVDNGCGMEDIEACVDAFKSSKVESSPSHDTDQSNMRNMTTGRYGIGLTLCLLHAQRLVPNSYASITSSTSSAPEFTRASYVVDVDGDSIRCDKIEKIPKKFPEESGTAVSVLVPGGQTALRAWPRLAEYFARFQLSLGLTCSLQVLAPSLSAVPLFIRPPAEVAMRNKSGNGSNDRDHDNAAPDTIQSQEDELQEDHESWTDGMASDKRLSTKQATVLYESDETNSDQEQAMTIRKRSNGECRNKINKLISRGENNEAVTKRRNELLVASTAYLKRPVLLKNVAHSMQPIRLNTHQGVERPMLEVDMIVYGGSDDNDNDAEDRGETVLDPERSDHANNGSASLMLVRLVNRVPLLDGAEASACGLVRGLCWKQSMWSSFGLYVVPADERSVGSRPHSASLLAHLFAPTFMVRDSDQVAPFFEKTTHSQLDTDDDCTANKENEFEEQDTVYEESRQKRKKNTISHRLLPANVRIGKILVITQIHAKPSSLPLPTLSKGRLPMNERSIDDALELGIISCLRSLQRTNPALLLTTQQLKETERDGRYIPAAAAAIASIARKSKNETFRNSVARSVLRWTDPDAKHKEDTSSTVTETRNSQDQEEINSAGVHGQQNSSQGSSIHAQPTFAWLDAKTLGPLIKGRLRWICTSSNRKKMLRQRKRKKDSKNNEGSDHDAGQDFPDGGDSSVSTYAREDNRQEAPNGRVLEKWEDPFSDNDSW